MENLGGGGDAGGAPEVAASREDEITERVKAVEDGRAVGMAYGEAMVKIESRFGL